MQLTRNTIRTLIKEEITNIMREQDAPDMDSEEVASVQGETPVVDLDAMTGQDLADAVKVTIFNSIGTDTVPSQLSSSDDMIAVGAGMKGDNPLLRYVAAMAQTMRGLTAAERREATSGRVIFTFGLSSDSLVIDDYDVQMTGPEVTLAKAALEQRAEDLKQSVNAAGIVPNYVGQPIKLSGLAVEMPFLI